MSEKIRLTAVEKPQVPDPDIQNATRFCPKCGREIPQDRRICGFCENTGAFSVHAQPRLRKPFIILLICFSFLFLLVLALYLTR